MAKNSEYTSSIQAASSYAKLRKFLISEDTPFAAREAYKSARTHLLYVSPGEGCKKIAFTSSVEHEGKSITCMNLAISIAQAGKRVLIIDGDLRRPMLNNVFELRESHGLSEQLAGIPDAENPGQIFACKTRYENLAVLPAGHIPPNPTELLSSPRLHDILEVLEQYFDYIFIDTPPIGAVTDTALLIPEMHGHIFVVRAGETRKEGLKRAVDTMEQLGANILGFVLNDYDPRKSHHSYGYYGKSRGYKYGKYGHYGYGRKQQGSNKENEVKNENREIYSGIKSDQDKSE